MADMTLRLGTKSVGDLCNKMFKILSPSCNLSENMWELEDA